MPDTDFQDAAIHAVMRWRTLMPDKRAHGPGRLNDEDDDKLQLETREMFCALADSMVEFNARHENKASRLAAEVKTLKAEIKRLRGDTKDA